MKIQHYRLTTKEVEQMTGKGPGTQAKDEPLCRSGDFHALLTDDPDKVTCAFCQKRL